MVAPVVLGAVIEGAITLFNRLVPDKNAQAKFENAIRLKQFAASIENDLKQIDVNIEQAKHPSVFVAGGRPAAMWMGVFAMGIGLLAKGVLPALLALLVLFPDIDVSRIDLAIDKLNAIDVEFFIIILGQLLGLGAMRSYDKTKGVDTKGIKR